MTQQVHIIHRVNLEIEAPDERSAKDLQDEAVRLLYNEILPRLERWLDSLMPSDKFIQFDHLDLTMNQFNRELFERQFADDVFRSFRDNFEKIISQHSELPESSLSYKPLTCSADEKMIEGFLYFLVTGRSPWWSRNDDDYKNNEIFISKALLSVPDAISRLNTTLKENEMALERLLMQFSNSFIVTIISILLKGRTDMNKKEIPVEFERFLKRFDTRNGFSGLAMRQLQSYFLRMIFKQIILNQDFFEINSFTSYLRDLKTETLSKKSKHSLQEYRPEIKTIKPAGDRIKIRKKSEEDGLYVSHAGLVLLYPFLESLFRDFDLLVDEGFRDFDSGLIAAHLLNYLATKQEAVPESQMIVEKYLCGIDLNDPVYRFVYLTRTMKKECENLLKAVIRHWKVLKSTSPDGLREGFLQREGKLILNDFQNRLIVENKSYDLLLTYLPWSYSIIKLPWLNEALFVEWFA